MGNESRHSLHDVRLSHESMLYNPQEQLLIRQVTIAGKHIVANYMSYFQLPCMLQA